MWKTNHSVQINVLCRLSKFGSVFAFGFKRSEWHILRDDGYEITSVVHLIAKLSKLTAALTQISQWGD